jgi:NADPH:quinone reductase-like Zn-dependent oxidoreductase
MPSTNCPVMRAFRLHNPGFPSRHSIDEVAAPNPGSGEVLLRVRACGLNRLDLWTEQGVLPVASPLPLIQGCEVSGEVAGLGPEVSAWKLGDRVAIQSNLFCGVCQFCQAGQESLCLESRMLGVECDGGLAEFVAVPGSALVRLPDALSFETSAAVTLAASTAMHMLTDRSQVSAGQWVLAMGASSGVGAAAIQIAKALGGRVITTGSTEEKRQLGLSLGAEHAVDSADDQWPAQVRRLTGKRGVDLVAEHIGGAVLARCFHCLARGGTIVTCGATAGQTVPLDLWPMFVKQQRLVGSYGRNRADMVRTLEFVGEGKLRPVIDRVLPLDKTEEGFQALRERRVLGKVLVTLE